MKTEQMRKYLRATGLIDSDHPAIREKAEELSGRLETYPEKAVALFYFVRDQIRYNAFMPRFLPEHFRASNTLAGREGFCIQKAVLLAALSRAAQIPARLRFAVIRNHLLPRKFSDLLEGNELPDHGFAELYLGGRWVKANPAFDIGTCRDFIVPVEFDGQKDALFHPRTKDGRPHIEYVLFRGSYGDVPFEEVAGWLTPVLTPEGRAKVLGRPLTLSIFP
jgi:transglutaminase-like putative cysteine protease